MIPKTTMGIIAIATTHPIPNNANPTGIKRIIPVRMMIPIRP